MKTAPVLFALALALSAAASAAADGGPVPGVWTEDFEGATAAARTNAMPALLYFTGRDWCPNCQRLAREVLETPEWSAWASTNLYLVELDFPHDGTRQHPRRRAINKALADHYGVDSFPTLVLLGRDGREISRPVVRRGAPPAFYERQVAVALFEADGPALRAALGEEKADAYFADKAAAEAWERGVEERRLLLNSESARLRAALEAAPDAAARAAAQAELNARLTELVRDYRSFQENGFEAAHAAALRVEAARDELAGPAGNPFRLFAPGTAR